MSMYELTEEEIKKKENSLSLSFSVYASLNIYMYMCYRMIWNIKERKWDGFSHSLSVCLSHLIYIYVLVKLYFFTMQNM